MTDSPTVARPSVAPDADLPPHVLDQVARLPNELSKPRPFSDSEKQGIGREALEGYLYGERTRYDSHGQCWRFRREAVNDAFRMNISVSVGDVLLAEAAMSLDRIAGKEGEEALIQLTERLADDARAYAERVRKAQQKLRSEAETMQSDKDRADPNAAQPAPPNEAAPLGRPDTPQPYPASGASTEQRPAIETVAPPVGQTQFQQNPQSHAQADVDPRAQPTPGATHGQPASPTDPLPGVQAGTGQGQPGQGSGLTQHPQGPPQADRENSPGIAPPIKPDSDPDVHKRNEKDERERDEANKKAEHDKHEREKDKDKDKGARR